MKLKKAKIELVKRQNTLEHANRWNDFRERRAEILNRYIYQRRRQYFLLQVAGTMKLRIMIKWLAKEYLRVCLEKE